MNEYFRINSVYKNCAKLQDFMFSFLQIDASMSLVLDVKMLHISNVLILIHYGCLVTHVSKSVKWK